MTSAEAGLLADHEAGAHKAWDNASCPRRANSLPNRRTPEREATRYDWKLTYLERDLEETLALSLLTYEARLRLSGRLRSLADLAWPSGYS